ncbi:MAG: hypothetical protein HRU34_01415, partial [Richelia sp.]|nr:hypothetical protein [Richelia sp.]
ESGDDFTKFSTISQWFQTLIHPALMQRHSFLNLFYVALCPIERDNEISRP